MANVNPSEPYIKIAHSLQEQMMVTKFTEYQRRMLDLIYRLSIACGRKTAYVPRQKDFELVGVREVHVKAHLDALIRDKVIVRDGFFYAFNLKFDDWRVSRAFNYNPKKIQELVHLNLSMPDKDLLTENVSTPDQLTDSVSQLTDSVSPEPPQTYVLRKLAVPELASAKDSILPTTKESESISTHIVVEGFLEILPRVSGWVFDKYPDKLWANDLIQDYPETELSDIKACADYYSSKDPVDKGEWKNRFRRWMKRERGFKKEKGDGNGKGNKDSQHGKQRVTGNRPREEYKTPWL